MRNPRVILAILTAIIGIGAFAVAIDVDTTDDGNGHKHRTITVRVDGVDRDRKADDTVVADAKAVAKLDDAVKGDLGDSGLDAGSLPEPLGGPLAAQDFPGCRTQFVRNMSSRNGAQVRLIVLHYTVSRDNGWPSNNALTAMSNDPANGVSWTFSIGGRYGNCAYNVPLSMKPWTQANANPYSVGIEVIRYGDEGTYTDPPGQARLVAVVRELEARLGIPNQRGAVSNCQPTRPGIVRHVDLGLCGGGHHDTDPFPDPIPGLVAAVGRVQISATDRADCRKVHKGHPRRMNPAQLARRRTRIRRLHSRRLHCVNGRVKRLHQ